MPGQAEKLYVGSYGMQLEVDTRLQNLADFTAFSLAVLVANTQAPVVWTCTQSTSQPTVITCVIASATWLPQPGTYLIQAVVQDLTRTLYGSTATLQVYPRYDGWNQ